jgi:hypothetical protein
MPLKYNDLKEHQIRLLTLEPRHESHETVHCKLEDHFFLHESFFSRNRPHDGKKIPFEGLIKDVCPEYLHVSATPKKKGLRARGKARLRRAFGVDSHNEGDVDPLDQPGNFDFAISVGRERMGGTDPEPTPRSLPQNWTPRYTWGDFVALSYTWGDSRNTREIVVNGEKHEVTVSLHAALTELQKQECFYNGLKIWADALCLNQGNSEELKVQCLRMHEIYQTAGNVVVWLGVEQSYANPSRSSSHRNICSDHAIFYLQWLSAYFRTELLEYADESPHILEALQFRETVNFQLKNSLHMITTKIKNEFDYIDIDEYGWLSIFHFFDNDYWKRLWIIQELVMGTEDIAVFCGSRVTGWRYIRDSALIIAAVSDFVSNKIRAFASREKLRLPDLSARQVDHVAAIAELGIRANRMVLPQAPPHTFAFTTRPGPEDMPRLRGSGLLQLLALATQAHCSKPVDRVFGLLHVPPLRRPDVNSFKVTSLQDLYIQFALQCIFSGDPPRELGPAEHGTWSEVTTVTQHGKVTASSNIEKYAFNGTTPTLDMLAIVDGFVDLLVLPSWVANLSAPTWRKTTPFLGPWHASGLGQGVPLPRLVQVQDNQVFGTTSLGAFLSLRAALVDTVDGLGAIQSLMQERMIMKTPAQGESLQIVVPIDGELPDGHFSVWHAPSFRTDVVQPNASTATPDDDFGEALSMALVGGADYHGDVIDPACLLTSISLRKPHMEASDIDLWIWDFINSSKDLKIGSKNVGDYFNETDRTDAELAKNQSYGDPEDVLTAKSSMAAKVKSRRLFLTSTGSFLGLGPMAMRQGDVGAILVGLNRPVIIRPGVIVSGLQTWRVIGECFVHGMMQGELADIGFLAQSEEFLFG